MKMVLGVLAVLCLSGGAGELKMKIPATLYPVPEKRSMDRKTIAAAEAYLKLSPEKLASLGAERAACTRTDGNCGLQFILSSGEMPFLRALRQVVPL